MSINQEDARQCVGSGWSGLIDAIYDRLPSTACVSQVKEKFGGLCFYVDNVDIEVLDFIEKMEAKSYETCEVCGLPGKSREEGGWIKTLCDEHSGGTIYLRQLHIDSVSLDVVN